MSYSSFQKTKRLLLSRSLWRKQIVFWAGAIAVGIIASYYAIAADHAQEVFNGFISNHPYLPLITSPLLFALISYLTINFAAGAKGSGIPQAIAARVSREKESRRWLLGAHIIPAKIILTLLGLLAGASIGREGPTVQIGACILLLCANFARISSQRGIVLAGAAAGVAAAFNTPLAGIVFAIEEMARAFEHRNSAIVLIAIVFAGAASMSILGNYSYFGYTDAHLSIARDWPAIVTIGIAGGLLGSLFSYLFANGGKLIGKYTPKLKERPVAIAALCGLIVAVLGISTGGLSYGSGYGLAHDLLTENLEPAWWQMPAKFLATLFSGLSGIPGGIFSPSLSVGAGLGAEISSLFPETPMQGAVILAMVAYFAGVTQAPITAFVIVLEVTGHGTVAVPLIAAAMIAAIISRLISPVSLYHILAKQFILESHQHKAKENEKN